MVKQPVAAGDFNSQFQQVLGNLEFLQETPQDLGVGMHDKGRRPNDEELADQDRSKRSRGPGQSPKPWATSSGDSNRAIQLLTSLMIRADRDLNLLHQQDRFILYMNKDHRGIQVRFLQEAQSWRTQAAQMQATMPLRQHLSTILMTELLDRATKLSKLSPTLDTVKNLQKQQVWLPCGSWPYLQWCHQKKAMQLSKKTQM